MRKRKMIILIRNMEKSSILIMLFMMMAIQSALAQQDTNLVQYDPRWVNSVKFKSDIFVLGWFTIGDSLYHTQIRQISRQGYYINTLGDTVFISNSDTLSFEDMKKGEKIIYEIGKRQGRNETGRRVWYDSINIKHNTTYSFSCHVRNPSAFSPSMSESSKHDPRWNLNLVLCVNRKKISKIFTAVPNYENIWYKDDTRSGNAPGPEVILSGTFTSGPDHTKIEVSLNEIMEIRGYSIELWNIVIKEIEPVKRKSR